MFLMAGKSNRLRFWWPEIVDERTAREAAGYGAGMAAFQAVLILLLVVLNASGIEHVWGFNLWNLSDVALFVLLAWLIYWRLSRTAAVFALVWYPIGQVEFFYHHPDSRPDIRLLIYTLMYVQGVRGTFAYHEFVKRRQRGASS
jgi:hypothetical protein